MADAMLAGLAARRFLIVPGAEAKLTVWANRMAPGLVRWVADRAQRRVEHG